MVRIHSFFSAIVISLLCAFAFSFGALGASFSDVSSSHPNYKAIETLANAGVINGYEDGSFQPEKSVNRVEALKMILGAAGITVQSVSDSGFSDVPADQWFSSFVMTAKDKNIVSGDGSTGNFFPARTVQKAEFLKMALLAFGNDVSKHNGRTGVANDVPNDAWFVPYISYARALLIISPDSNNNVYPTKELSRAECAEIIYQILILGNGGDVQKYLRLTESELLNVLLALSTDSVAAARSHVDSAVFYSGLALEQRPNEGVVKAAQTIALALQDLVTAYESGINQDPVKVKEYALLAKEKAGEAYGYSTATQPIGKKIKQYADELIAQVE